MSLDGFIVLNIPVKAIFYGLRNTNYNQNNMKTHSEYRYYYAWQNNKKRKTLYKRHFKVLARGTMNARLIQFLNGQREIISGAAVRRIHIWY
jgi:hypothetical protein